MTELPDDVKARTPAPEGEAWRALRRVAEIEVDNGRGERIMIANWIIQEVAKSKPLYASPVVPAPEGEAWRTVPVEPTEAMLVNGREALMPLVRLDGYGPLIGIWKDMLAATRRPVGGEEIEYIIRRCVFADDATEFTGVLQGIPEAADAILAALSRWKASGQTEEQG